MKKSKNSSLVCLLAFAILPFSCTRSGITPIESQTSTQCPDAGPFVKEVVSAEGIVWFNPFIKQYQISVSTGTLNTQDICFVCDLPEEFEKEGLRVTFTGEYYTFKGEVPQVIGASYYYLTVKRITKHLEL